MKTLHVVASINRNVGGPAVTVTRLAAELSAQGVNATVSTLDYAAHGPQAELGGASLESMRAPLLTRVLRGWSPAFGQRVAALAHDGVDVIHNHGLWMLPNFYARRAARLCGLPLVVSPRGMLDDWSLRRSRVRKFVAWKLFEEDNLGFARLFHATSAAEARSIRIAGFAQPVAIVPNGVDVPDLARVPGREILERRFVQLRDRNWLLFMSRLHPKKGLAELVRAWESLAPQFPDWHLLVAGPDLDGYGATMKQGAESLLRSGRLTFAGMVAGEEKASALANSAVMALPTHSENFGIVVAEALAHGTPVITTTAAPWREILEKECGWWIEDRQEALRGALAAAMSLAPAQRREMGARGRALVTERYSWARSGREMKAAYQWILGTGPRPDFVHQS